MKGNNYVEIFKNPISSELSDLKKQTNLIRMFLHEDGTVYIWDGNITHDNISKLYPNIISSYRLSCDNSNVFI